MKNPGQAVQPPVCLPFDPKKLAIAWRHFSACQPPRRW
jgi:hypothetical protein